MVMVAAVILLGVGVWVSTQLGSDRSKVECSDCGGDGMLLGRMTVRVAAVRGA